MVKKEPKTLAGLILAILDKERGLFLSALEIAGKLRNDHYYIVKTETVRLYLTELLPALDHKTDRCGANRIPLTIYRLPEKINTNV